MTVRKLWSFVLALILMTAAAAVALAPEPAPGSAPSDPSRDPRRAERRAQRHFLTLHSDGVAMKRDGSTVQFRSQKGVIQAKDADSITLKSADGYTQTYVINDRTRVRERGKPSSPAELKSGERVKAFALKEGSSYTARLIRLRRRAAPRLEELEKKS